MDIRAVGWVSVLAPAAQLVIVFALPESPRTISAAAGEDAADSAVGAAPAHPFRHWWWTLRAGLKIAVAHRVIRGAVLATIVVMGLSALDEYFGLLLREQGAALTVIPLLLATVSATQAVGGLLVERAAGWTSARLALVIAAAAVALAGGALIADPIGIMAVALGYGAISMTILVLDVRLQQVTPSALRATVTSVAGAGSEAVAVLIYIFFALGAGSLGMGVTIAVVALLLLGLSPLFARLIPPVTDGDTSA